MKAKTSIKGILAMIFMTYFYLQSLYIVFKKWQTLNFTDKVTAIETVNFATITFLQAFELNFFSYYDSILHVVFRGEFFGFREGIIIKNSDHAFFRCQKYLKGGVNCVNNVNELHQAPRIGGRGGVNGDEFGLRLRSEVRRRENNDERDQGNVTKLSDLHGRSFSELEKPEVGDEKSEATSLRNTHGAIIPNTSSKVNNNNSDCNNFVRRRAELFDMDVNEGDKKLFSRDLSIIEEYLNKSAKNIVYAGIPVKSICIAVNLVPIYSIINYFLKDSQIEGLKSTFMIYVPFTESYSHENIEQFMVVSVIQFVYIFLYLKLTVDLLTVALLSYGMLRTEMSLFLNRLQDFDARFCKNYIEIDDVVMRRSWHAMLARRFDRCIEHHQEIMRRIHQVNDFVSFCGLYCNSIICLQLVVAIFMLQGNSTLKLKYGIFSIMLVALVAYYSEEGQILENKIIRASYSYFNILNQLKGDLIN
ncbi:uncharacterized protein LOC120353804 isoform X2 [Nilaparvata lugens]|uniref:uncharacterized protein LOC120353804 isoform X2 n=1 Tax=Nilaparvata lugens TaxID=108931 RepID=UPI00193E5A09|nr:uncharacterized protein LOC120353804 isoform X2 [Nilaparvata lugens]